MSKVVKVLIGAVIALVVGSVIFGIAIVALAKKGVDSSDSKYVTNEFEIEDDFSNISINAFADDVQIRRSTDGKCSVVCVDHEEIEHDAYVEGDTLYVTSEAVDNTYFFMNFEIFSNQAPRIIVYLTGDEYDLSLEMDTGDIVFDEGFTFGNINFDITTGDVNMASINILDKLNFDITTGDIDLTDVECDQLVYNGTTGDINCVNTVANGAMTINVTTGDINFDRCDASEIYIDAVTGDVSLILLSDKNFDVDVLTGDSDYPRSGEGGTCRVEVTTGDVDIAIAE